MGPCSPRWRVSASEAHGAVEGGGCAGNDGEAGVACTDLLATPEFCSCPLAFLQGAGDTRDDSGREHPAEGDQQMASHWRLSFDQYQAVRWPRPR